jgi:(p)ppGpp synthase/HD superfamily hydrolase
MKNAQSFFTNLHDVECNQKYNKTLPYSFHLEMVAKQAEKFAHHIPSDNPYHDAVWAGIWGHDSIEDARLTYNDVRNMFGDISADIVFLCTEFKGKTRAERKPTEFYLQLRENDLAVFVKLCDIIANTKFSLLTNSSMYSKYKAEYFDKVKPLLYMNNQYEDMWLYMDKLYQL